MKAYGTTARNQRGGGCGSFMLVLVLGVAALAIATWTANGGLR